MRLFNFSIFSRRSKPAQAVPVPITPFFRNRVLLLCRDTFDKDQTGNYLGQFWAEIHQKLQYLHGAPVLAPRTNGRTPVEDLLEFLQTCDSEHFLDFVEYIFQADVFWRFTQYAPDMVQAINTFFQQDKLPYLLTDYVQVRETDRSGPYGGTITRVTAHPKVVLREQELLHETGIQPTLTLLTDPAFASANAEFLEALEDYRRRDYGDCLTKCGSAFESVLKVICERKGWPYAQTDTSARLLKTVLPRTTLDSFFEQPLLIVASIRNRLSKAHGAGALSKSVSPQIARYAINATAAAILLLVEETR